MKIFNYVSIGIIILIVFALISNKDSFNPIMNEPDTGNIIYIPPQPQQGLSKADLEDVLKVVYSNGPPKGANVTLEQSKYDLVFKDIVVFSKRRDITRYPNPNSYSVTLNLNINQIYKAELIDVYVPAATDPSVNIPSYANRLYFYYKSNIITPRQPAPVSTYGYVIIQAGTYMSPAAVADELTRQIGTTLRWARFDLGKHIGVSIIYDKNLNRYVFRDLNYNIDPATLPTLIIYPDNGDSAGPLTVQNSIAPLLKLNYTNIYISKPYTSGPKYIFNNSDNVLEVRPAQPGDFGEQTKMLPFDVPLNGNCEFSNCILSDMVLTTDKIFLSLGKLNGDTCNIINDENGSNMSEMSNIFCQVPNNTCVSSAAVKTLLGQPHNFSAIQFYNPPLSKINKLDIKWYSEYGTLLRILDHGFTIRIHYFQKMLQTTDFSYPIVKKIN